VLKKTVQIQISGRGKKARCMFRSIYFRLACAAARPRPRARARAAASVQIQTVSMLQSVNGVSSPSELLNIVGIDHLPQESSVGTGS
jgi:hypothetical protein